MKRMYYWLLLIVAACNTTPTPEESRSPTPEEVKTYIEEGERRGRAKAVAENEINDRITELLEEKKTLEFEVEYRKQMVEADNQRLFRRIRTDTVKAWLEAEKRIEIRINKIDKEVARLNKALRNL